MMKSFAALALLLLAAVAVPSASAQGAPTGVTLTIGDLAAPIPYEGAATLPVDVQVGCATILQNLPAPTVTITAVSPPAWLAVAETSADLADPGNGPACLTGSGFMVQHFDVPLAVTKDAPGVVDHVVEFTATLGSETSTAPATLTVAYHVNYTVVPDVKFPLTVNGTQVSFNVTITQASNARSMVMVEELKVSAGTLSGLASQVYENDAGQPDSKTYKVTYKPPTGEWSNATAAFTAYGHYLLLDGRAGDFDAGTPMTFSFVAGEHAHEDEEGGKESPAPVGVLVALGLVALAAFVRRRA